MKKFGIVLVLSMLILSSCGHRKVFESYTKIPNLAWNRFSPVKFEFPVEDTVEGYELTLVVRHMTEIPYHLLDIESAIYAPDGEVRIKDSRIRVKDNEGKLLGDGMGDLWDVKYTLHKDLKFNAKGLCTVEISSRMSQLDVIGIIEIGLIVKKN